MFEINHIAASARRIERCLNCPKSRPCAAASNRPWKAQRFTKVEVRRGDLRWPLPKDFAQRLKGKTVTGLGRRAKYLLADLSSGDVLVMHLGMSGSFHVFRESKDNSSAATITSGASTSRTTTSSFTCRPARS